MDSGIFDKDGWLVPGVFGHQPSLAESYINVGSLYLCTTVFLPLGLPISDPFWSAPDEKWSAQKIYLGKDMDADHAIYSDFLTSKKDDKILKYKHRYQRLVIALILIIIIWCLSSILRAM
jgi:hypothetical protein